jgi:hypothetical protein
LPVGDVGIIHGLRGYVVVPTHEPVRPRMRRANPMRRLARRCRSLAVTDSSQPAPCFPGAVDMSRTATGCFASSRSSPRLETARSRRSRIA